MSVAPEIIRWSLNMNREFYWMVHIYCWDHNRSNFNKTGWLSVGISTHVPWRRQEWLSAWRSLTPSQCFQLEDFEVKHWDLANHWETTGKPLGNQGNLWKFDIWVAISKIRNDSRDPFVYVARPICSQWIQAIENTSFWQRRNCWSSELKGWSAISSPSCTSGRHGLMIIGD